MAESGISPILRSYVRRLKYVMIGEYGHHMQSLEARLSGTDCGAAIDRDRMAYIATETAKKIASLAIIAVGQPHAAHAYSAARVDNVEDVCRCAWAYTARACKCSLEPGMGPSPTASKRERSSFYADRAAKYAWMASRQDTPEYIKLYAIDPERAGQAADVALWALLAGANFDEIVAACVSIADGAFLITGKPRIR